MPGSGKSSAIRGAYHRLLEEKDVLEGLHYVAAFSFKKTGDPLLRSPDGMYRALLHQILSLQRQIHGVIRRYAWREGASRKPSPLGQSGLEYRQALQDVLRYVCKRFELTILIDAVDECAAGDRIRLERFFYELVGSDDFETLRVCLSSRHFGASSWLSLRPPNPIEAMNPPSKLQSPVVEVELENHTAIRKYLDAKLSVYGRDTKELTSVKEKILTMSSGIFTWVAPIVDRLVEDLCEHEPGNSPLELRLKPTPKPLKDLYESILRMAEDPMKTWRFLQWLLMASDLSVRGWRDLIPFLQSNSPQSLKQSRGSKDWARGSIDPDQDDSYIPNLQRIVCRISLGLAHVAKVSERNLKGPGGDCYSIIGEAGSWKTADGDRWIIRPIHESLKQFLQDEYGFAALNSRIRDHHGDGLIMAMNTCLDFIHARESSRRGKVSALPKEIPVSEDSTMSLLSDGDASANSGTSGFSSAGLAKHRRAFKKSRAKPSNGSLSTEEMDLYDEDIQMGAILAHLNGNADRSPESSQEKRQRIESWRDSVAGDGDSLSCSSQSTGPSSQPSTRSLRWEDWSSELLSCLLTIFAEFAKSAEERDVDPSPVIIRLCEGRLWQLWLTLSEMAANTTLKQWAESQRLHSWVQYLSLIGGTRTARTPGQRRSAVFDINLKYCFDGGDRFVREYRTLGLSRPVSCGSCVVKTKDLSESLFGRVVETD